MSGTPFKARAALGDLPKGAERAIIEQFRGIEAALNRVQVVERNATPVLNVPAYMAKPGELVLLEGNAGGTLVTLPPGSSQNIEQTIRIVLVGGVLSPGVTISIVGRKGTIDGAQTFVMAQRMLVELTSVGERGWAMTCCGGGGGGLTPLQVFEQIYPIGSIYISTNSTNPGTSLGFGTWTAFGAGRVPVGLNAGDPDFDTDEETGGAKTVAATGANTAVSAGTPAGTNSAPTFTGAALAAHTHELPIQLVSNVLSRQLSSATFGTGTSRTSLNQQTETANATNAPVALAEARTAGTPAGTVSAPTFTGSALGTHNHTFTGTASSVVQPYIVVRMWKRTA